MVETLAGSPSEISINAPKESHLSREEAWKAVWSNIAIIPNDEETINKYCDMWSMQPTPELLYLPQNLALVANKDFQTKTRSTTHPLPKHLENTENATPSDARYTVEERIVLPNGMECMLYASELPPGGKTTIPPHVHYKSTEHYFKISGEAYLGRVWMRDYEVVPPNTPHVVESSENSGAVFIILLEDVGGIPKNEIHNYPTK